MLTAHPDSIDILVENGVVTAAGGRVRLEETTAGLRILCHSTEPLRRILLRWNTAIPRHAAVLADHWERGYGDREWRGLVAERVLPWYAIVHDAKFDTSAGYGVRTGASSFASWRIDQQGVTLVLDVRNGDRGVVLGNRELCAAIVVSLSSNVGESPFAFGQRFCKSLCAAPRLSPKPIYGGNDWYSRYGENSAETVKQDAGLIRELSPDRSNPPVFVIDAGWSPTGSCNGAPYDRGASGFPDMASVAAWMRSHEIRPGIWIRPLLTTEKVPASWRVSQKHPFGGQTSSYLDPSIPEVLDLVKTDIHRLVAWGYEVIKHDFTTYDILGRWGFEMGGEITSGGWSFADRSRTTAEVITALYQAIREAATSSIIIGCNTLGHLTAGLYELQRSGDDTSGRHWERTRKMGINTLAMSMIQHNHFFSVDADCVAIMSDVPWKLTQQWLDVVARSGTPLFVSPHPQATGKEQRKAVQHALGLAAMAQSPGEPLDWLWTTSPEQWKFADGTTKTYQWNDYRGSVDPCP